MTPTSRLSPTRFLLLRCPTDGDFRIIGMKRTILRSPPMLEPRAITGGRLRTSTKLVGRSTHVTMFPVRGRLQWDCFTIDKTNGFENIVDGTSNTIALVRNKCRGLQMGTDLDERNGCTACRS